MRVRVRVRVRVRARARIRVRVRVRVRVGIRVRVRVRVRARAKSPRLGFKVHGALGTDVELRRLDGHIRQARIDLAEHVDGHLSHHWYLQTGSADKSCP